MPDLLISDLDPALYDRMRKAAEAQGKSMEQVVREALTETFKPPKEEAWAEADRIRAKIGGVADDSTDVVREWRDNDEPYR